MRRIAKIKDHPSYKRLMIHTTDDGVFVYLYNKSEDGSCTKDLWFQSVMEAEKYCNEKFRLMPSAFDQIDEVPSGCQHDWIQPTKVKISADGRREYLPFDPSV